MAKLRIPMAAVLSLFAIEAAAQEATLVTEGEAQLTHEQQLEDLQKKLEVASMRFMIASEIAKIAEEESKTAVSQAEGAEKRRLKSISEANSRQTNPGRISLVTARMSPVSNPGQACDAKWFMAYQCNGLPECAVQMAQGACGTDASQPQNFVVTYACGKPADPNYETRRGEFSFKNIGPASAAYLTCY